MPKGKFIVIEGGDGSGKTTQFNLLKEKLSKDGYKLELADFPQYGKKSAGLVEEYLNGTYGTAKEVGPYRASIFYAADRYDASFEMKKWLAEDKTILANRYTTSNMLHQAGKIQDEAERDKFLEWLEDLEYNIFAIPRPDVVFFLHVPAEISQKLSLDKEQRHSNLKSKNDIHENDLEHLKDAENAGIYVSKKYNWETIECIDENNQLRSIEDIHQEVCKKVEKYI
jgi:dTMP kinase